MYNLQKALSSYTYCKALIQQEPEKIVEIVQHFLQNIQAQKDLNAFVRAYQKEALQKQGKPQAIAEKIAQGKLSKFFQEHTLLAQPYLKENTQTVLQYLKAIDPQLRITGFKRLMIGTQ